MPPPSPAVPVGYYGPLTQEEAARRFGSRLSTSQSATSKADNTNIVRQYRNSHLWNINLYNNFLYNLKWRIKT